MVRLGMLGLEGKGGAPTLARSVLLLTFRRLHIPFLCGEADVDWLAFLP